MLLVFAIRKGKEGMTFVGNYDGNEFIPKLGFCSGIHDLYEYDYIEIYTVEGMTSHTPKRFFRNLEEKLKEEYIRIFGMTKQGSLFQ